MSAGVIKAGRAAVEAFLDDKQLHSGLKGMNAKLRAAGNIAAKAIGGVMVAAAATMVYKINQSMKELDAVGKQSRTLGMDPGEFMSLAYAADRSAGMASDAFARGYTRITEQLNAAQNEASGAAAVFRELGVDVAAMTAMGGEDRIKTLADAFAALPDDATRAQMAVRLFGGEQAKMVNLLAGGSDAITDLQKKWQDVTGLDPNLSTDAIEAANDSLADLKLTMDALFTKMALDNAGDMAALFELLAKNAREWRDSMPDGDQSQQRMIPWMADMAQIPMDPLKAWLAGAYELVAGAGTTIGEGFAGNFSEALDGLKRATSGWLRMFVDPFAAVGEWFDPNFQSDGEKIQNQEDNRQAARASAESAQAASAKAAADSAAAVRELLDATEALIDSLDEQTQRHGENGAGVLAAAASQDALAAAASTTEEKLQRLAAAMAAIDAAGVPAELRETVAVLREEAEQAGAAAAALAALSDANIAQRQPAAVGAEVPDPVEQDVVLRVEVQDNAAAVDALDTRLQQLTAAFRNVAAAARTTAVASEEQLAATQELMDASDSLIESLEEQVRYYGMTKEQIMAAKLQQDAMTDSTGTAAAQLDRLNAAMDALGKLKISEELDKAIQSLREEAEQAGKTADEIARLRMEKLKLQAVASMQGVENADGSVTWDDPAAMEQMNQQLADLATATQQASTARLNEELQQLTASFYDAADAAMLTQEQLDEIQIRNLELQGAGAKEVAEARDALNRKTKAEKQAEQQGNAERLRERNRTSREMYDAELAMAQELLDQQLISEEDFARERARLRGQYLDDDSGRGRTFATGGFSSETVLRRLQSAVAPDTSKKQEELLEDGNQEAARTNQLLEDIIRRQGAQLPARGGGWRQRNNNPAQFRQP